MTTICNGCVPCGAPSVWGILPPIENPIISKPIDCLETICINFDQFTTGTVESSIIFPGFTLSTNQNATLFPLMIFDSATPTLGYEDLGSPNETCCTPGLGVGIGGEMGQPGQNCEDLKKVLIISNNPPNPLAPVPKPDGGIINVDFYEDVQVCEVHLLNVSSSSSCSFVKLYDFNNNLLTSEPIICLGVNSFQIVKLSSSRLVRKMTIELVNNAALAKFVYKLCLSDCLCTVRICEEFDDFSEGTVNMKIPKANITTNDPIAHPAMIFNSTVPTAGDFDLGSPNNTCIVPGAGVGLGGELGQPGENCIDLSHILIISDDANSAVPKAKPTGGQFIFDFCAPVIFKEMHFLNAATDGDTVVLYDTNGVPIDSLLIPNVGVNGFTKIQSILSYSIQKVVVTVSGKTAISKICYCANKGGDDEIDIVQLLDNSMTPVAIECTELQGTYMLLVESVNTNGAKATFMASSAFDSQLGSIARLTNAPSITSESIHLRWLPNEKIKLYHDVTKMGGTGALIDYKVKILTL